MARVNRSSIQRHKKLLKHAKGYWGRAGTCYRVAKRVVEKGWQHAYRHRREKKREMRALWIQRINAAVRESGMKYSTFMGGVLKANIGLDRKALAHLAIHNKAAFSKVVEQVQSNII